MGKVIVVEDDPTTRFMMSEFLELLGVDCELASSGFECLSKLVDNPKSFDMILMDIHMPKVTGAETTQWIRDMPVDPPSRIPIIAVTADGAYCNPDVLRSSGLNDVLPKPVSLNDLERTVQQYLG